MSPVSLWKSQPVWYTDKIVRGGDRLDCKVDHPNLNRIKKCTCTSSWDIHRYHRQLRGVTLFCRDGKASTFELVFFRAIALCTPHHCTLPLVPQTRCSTPARWLLFQLEHGCEAMSGDFP